MKIQFKQVKTQEDIAQVASLAKVIWHHTYDRLLPQGQVEYMLEQFQSEQAVVKQMEQQNYRYFLIYKEEKPCGFVGLSPELEHKGEMFLSKVYLHPDIQGRGVATKVFGYVFGYTQALGLQQILLTVNKENRQAIGVYQHLGFERVDSVVSDIGSGYVMDDYIMVKKL